MIWLLFVINTLDKISISSASLPSELAAQVKNILKSCFADRLNPIAISDDLSDIVYKEMADFPVLVISEGFKAKIIEPYFNPRYPTYVLAVHSVKKLKTTLQEFATLSTWSIDSIFFVVRYSEVNCDDDGRKVLEILRKMDQLAAFYICFKPGKSIDGTNTMIYTVNPFSKRASLPWKEVPHTRPISKSYQDQNENKRSTLYKRPYENESKLCLSLKFEKTKHLDDYPVSAVIESSSKKKKKQFHNETVKLENVRNSLPFSFFSYFATLFSALNVSSVVNVKRVGNYANNVSLSALNSLINGTHDICLNVKFISTPGYESVDIVDPNAQNELLILSHKNGVQKYLFFWSRKNWPLKKQADIVTLRCHESGFMRYWLKQDIYLPLKKLREKENSKSKSLSEFIPTEFEDLKFLYISLASLTLGLSVFALIVEVLIARRKIRLQRRLVNERRRRIESKLQKFKRDNSNDRFLQDKVRIVKGRVFILP
ncbi:hypothetical protein KQX54_006486 [Cotesia glomerata]|uniref:Receptor ligand binding region domain-containing protein n=1 Tax=Cotesia glomerata TaxID=32391 RepID=A0AAV7HWH8_COTGL|nr:hypothetical protein KQX54_006486 [Cotesia glomerata]